MNSRLVNVQQEKIALRDNKDIPAFLFGTKGIDENSMQLMLKNGFFSYDMASVYNTDDVVFNGIIKYIAKNDLKNCRSSFHFCYKLDAIKLLPEQIMHKTNELLAKIATIFPDQSAYIDLLVIHSPNHNVPIEQSWACMKDLVLTGKVLNIGVSNFNLHHLKCMQNMGLTLPVINQVEINPFFSQPELINYCLSHQIKISSFRSIRNKAVAKDLELLAKIAKELEMTPIQILNSWKFTNGYQIIAVSRNPSHMEELKFVTSLTSTHMQQLNSLDKGEDGRTCAGSWSCFDFTGSSWQDYVPHTAIQT